MELQLLILLFVAGGVAGALYTFTQIVAPLFVVCVVLLFLPALGYEYSGVLLPLIATSVVSFIPILLLQWIKDMKAATLDSSVLIALSPGAAMGGVIGAQVVSFMSPLFFKLALSLVAALLLYQVIMQRRSVSLTSKKAQLMNLNVRSLRIPVGLLIGVVSIMAGGVGKVLAETVLTKTSVIQAHRHATAAGVALFVSIAAMVGFSFPALPLSYPQADGFIGGIQWLCCLTLAISQMLFYLLCQGKGNSLDHSVIRIALLVFIAIALSRIWLMPL
ncbi:TSUP family transporter [Marinomonas pollencensis]|uniref:Probable membrane transporter protein n=1 Tax=Marinomonas pollencensis TaxID=491954 RepID=A0A3E0DRC2_9GAMM|nr:TSUP family transporter [Marinomonas pollencensis]REG85687.1 sulfite exporter TauE/SafE [Marinomonas pollencensis]